MRCSAGAAQRRAPRPPAAAAAQPRHRRAGARAAACTRASACARVTAPTMLTLARQGSNQRACTGLHVGHADARQAASRHARSHRDGCHTPPGRKRARPRVAGRVLASLSGGHQALRARAARRLRERRARPAGAPPAARPGQQVGVGQRAQRKAHAVAAGAAAKAGAQIGPGLAQRVFIQRRLAARRAGPHALGRQAGRHAGQAGLVGRVAAAAGVEVELHIHHRRWPGFPPGNTWRRWAASSAAMGMPAMAACMANKASSARQQRANSYFFDSRSWTFGLSGGFSAGAPAAAVRGLRFWSSGCGSSCGHGQLVVAKVARRHRLHLRRP